MIKLIAPIGAWVLMIAIAAAQAPPAGQYRVERPVQPAAAGPNRLELDMALLAGSKPFPPGASGGRVTRGGLTDLRLFDPAGREVPYLLIDPPPITPVWRTGVVLPIAATKETSGFEADFQKTERVDRIRVEGIPAPFLKRLMLEGSGDRERWTLLVREGTLFDLPAERLRRIDLDFVAGDYRYFRVTWNDTNSGRVPMPDRVDARAVDAPVALPPMLAEPVPFEQRPSEPQRSRFRVQLPRGQLPIVMLQLDVDGTHIMRPVTVSEPHFDGRQVQPNVIGRAVLKRVTRDGIQADELMIPLSTSPREPQLEITVDDGDNPPLMVRSITAHFAALPTIFFESDGSPLVARYGDFNLEAPRYDLEAARSSVRLDAAAPARWGQPVTAAAATATIASPMPSTGSTMDPSRFAYARELGTGTPGLTAVPLDAAVLSHSSGVENGFSDLRIVDTSGRQVPYLVERLDEPLTIELMIRSSAEAPAGVEGRAQQSWYRLELPYSWLPRPRLTLQTSARVFRRQVQVYREVVDAAPRRHARQVRIAAHEWVHANADLPAPPLVLDLPPGEERELFVAIHEGDNKPLPLTAASVLLPSYRVRFFRPDTAPLRLVYGRQGLSAPQYDLALLTPQVLGATATEVAVAAETANQAAAVSEEPIVPPMVFWAVLALAIVVLLGIIVKLIRAEVPKPSESS